MAWLILEGWVCANDGGEARWWLRDGEGYTRAVKIVCEGRLPQSTVYEWNVSEFSYICSPAECMELAPGIVDLIIKEGL